MDTLQSREAKWLTRDPKAFEMAELESPLRFPLSVSQTVIAKDRLHTAHLLPDGRDKVWFPWLPPRWRIELRQGREQKLENLWMAKDHLACCMHQRTGKIRDFASVRQMVRMDT